MKKITTLILSLGFVLGTFAAGNVNLSLSDVTLGWGGGGGTLDVATGTLSVSQWEQSGWNFYPTFSTGEYTGVKMTFSEAVVQGGANLVVTYSDATSHEIAIAAGVTEVFGNFDADKVVSSIKISYFGSDPAKATYKISSTELIAGTGQVTPTANMTLDKSKISASWGYSYADGTLTVDNWASAGWTFVIPQSSYKGMTADFTEAVAQGYSTLSITDVNNKTQNVDLEGATTKTIAFESLDAIKSIQFKYGNWNNPADPAKATFKLGDCSLLFNAPSGIAEKINTEDVKDNAYYTLSGMRVTDPSSYGIYIHKGKKIIVK